MKSKLVACVNIVPKVTSIFLWEGNVCEDTEQLLMIKTIHANTTKVVDKVKEKHPYDVPEVIFTEIKEGLPDYLDWVRSTCLPK